MKVNTSLLTGKIYAETTKKKYDITNEAINAVLIRLIEGHSNNIKVTQKSTGKTFELCIKETE